MSRHVFPTAPSPTTTHLEKNELAKAIPNSEETRLFRDLESPGDSRSCKLPTDAEEGYLLAPGLGLGRLRGVLGDVQKIEGRQDSLDCSNHHCVELDASSSKAGLSKKLRLRRHPGEKHSEFVLSLDCRIAPDGRM